MTDAGPGAPATASEAAQGGAVRFRAAAREDVPAIVALYADDVLGATRERPDDLETYLAAYDRVAADPGQHLVVAERDGVVVGTLQLSVIPGLSRHGTTRSIVEAVRVAGSERGTGVGTALVEWAVAESGRLGATLVQLTTDRTRVDAHRFYERLGFTPSHLGFKRETGGPPDGSSGPPTS